MTNEVLETVAELRKAGLALDVVAYSAMIQALGWCKLPKEAEGACVVCAWYGSLRLTSDAQ